jgi:hypothetical protein
MKIVIPSIYEADFIGSIPSYAEVVLSGRSYESGVLESTALTSRNNSLAIGRLLQLLASKGVITAPEITGVLDLVENKEATFTEV